jgi:hypothetical protein
VLTARPRRLNKPNQRQRRSTEGIPTLDNARIDAQETRISVSSGLRRTGSFKCAHRINIASP